MKTLLSFLFACLLAYPASGAVMVDSYRYATAGGGPADRCAPLGDTVSSTVFDVDATCSESTDGSSQTWANMEATPADSESQTAYDFYRGAGSGSSTDDPTFNGSADTESAYWSVDGGDYFSIASGANTALLRDMHKTTGGSDFWIAFAGQTTATGGSFFSTQNDLSNNGMRIQSNGNAASFATFVQRTATTQAAVATKEGAFQTGTNFLIVISYSHSGNTYNVWINGVAQPVASTFATTTTNATDPLKLAGNPALSFLPTGARIYGMAFGNAHIDDTAAANLLTKYELRHNRSYSRRPQTTLAAAMPGIGVVGQVDANLWASAYGGGTTTPTTKVLNVIASPADGSGQTAYDFDIISAMPFLNLPDPKWDPAAGDLFTLTGSNTSFVDNLHKTTGGQDFWFAMAVNSNGNLNTANALMTSTNSNAAGAHGLYIGLDASEQVILNQVGTSAKTTNAVTSPTLTSGNYLIILSYSHSSNNWRVWINTGTANNISSTFSTSTAAANAKLTFNGEADAGADENEFDWRGFAFGNVYLDDTQATDIKSYYTALHGIAY